MYILWHFKNSLDWSTYWMWCICKKLLKLWSFITFYNCLFLILLNANIHILYQIYFEHKDHRRSLLFLKINLLLDISFLTNIRRLYLSSLSLSHFFLTCRSDFMLQVVKLMKLGPTHAELDIHLIFFFSKL